jgi:hypothetical protein
MFPNTSIGDAVVGIGPLTRSIGMGIADPPVNTKYSFLATTLVGTVWILLTCALGSTTTFLLGSASADAQNASAISATPHRPIQPTRRDSLNGVFIPILCSVSRHKTMTIAINFPPVIARENAPVATGQVAHWPPRCAVRSPPLIFRKSPRLLPIFAAPPVIAPH